MLSDAFLGEENRLLDQRQEESRQSSGITITVIFIGNTLGFALLLYAAWTLKRQNDKLNQLSNSLQSNNAFLDSLIDNIPMAIYVKEAVNLNYVRLNRAAEKLRGSLMGDLMGKNVYEIAPNEAEAVNASDRAVLAGSEVIHIAEGQVITANKGIRTAHIVKVPIYDNEGQPKYLLGIIEDITERKQAEQKIKALNLHLENRATELEAVNKELQSFTYSVSHDLRAPLRAINGYALMLEEDYRNQIDDAGKRYIAQIRGYSNQMGTLIDDLLNLARLGRQAMKSVEIDMNELLQGVLQTELVSWQKTHVKPETDIATLPAVKADPLLLRQVWANLISNALKYSGKNEAPRIRINGFVADQEVVYSVKDNGVGFDMAYYDKLFGVFQRLHRSDEFPGTGVGLAIVHRIVTRHGGKVWAQGKLNQGAEFFFALPLNPVADSDA